MLQRVFIFIHTPALLRIYISCFVILYFVAWSHESAPQVAKMCG